MSSEPVRRKVDKTLSFLDRLTLFEVAQETIGFMMAARTAKIHREKEKPNPDERQIAMWRQEFNDLHEELDRLRLDDDKAIQFVLDEYAPIVKASYEKSKAAKK